MAKGQAVQSDPSAANKGPSAFLVVTIVSVVAAAIGGGFAYFVIEPKPNEVVSDLNQPAPAAKPLSRFPNTATEVVLKPVIASLVQPDDKKVRMESSLIVAPGVPLPTALRAEIEQDIVVYLSGMKLIDVNGSRGLQNLRNDLDDRIKTRGQGAVLGFLITGLVFE